MNFGDWVNRVRSFSEGLQSLLDEGDASIEIAPPLSENEVEQLSAKWPAGIPKCLRSLWGEGSAQINCRYWWGPSGRKLVKLQEIFQHQDTVYGGVNFPAAEDVFPGNSGAVRSDDLLRATLGDFGLDLWCRSAVFMHIGNGDCLGLDPADNFDDPPVVYLSHDDDESTRIADSFSAFLAAWETLCFIGPEIWLLEYWINPATQRIDARQYKTEALRRLLIGK